MSLYRRFRIWLGLAAWLPESKHDGRTKYQARHDHASDAALYAMPIKLGFR